MSSDTPKARSNAPKPRSRGRPFSKDNPGKPFAKGNPGRPVGMRHRRTLIAQALLDSEAETITRKCIDLALEGDPTALKLSIDCGFSG
jgi:hypothetical protein